LGDLLIFVFFLVESPLLNNIQLMITVNVSEFLQFIGLRLVEPTPHRAYASERITVFVTTIVLMSRME